MTHPEFIVAELLGESHSFGELLEPDDILFFDIEWRHEDLELGLRHLDQELAVVQQLNLLYLVHWVEDAGLPLVGREQLEDVVKKEVANEVQEVTHQRQWHHLLAVVALHYLGQTAFCQVFERDQDFRVFRLYV